MAEFVEKRIEDMIPELEQMERINLFDKNEIRGIAKKLKEYEYKIQRHTKCKEDYLRYIQYEMDLLKLVRQRRDKFGITQKKADIDYAIANKMNKLYKDAMFKFQDDIRFWVAYIKFCKHVRFNHNVSCILGRMLQVHQDKPKCWYIAARWELEENNSILNARQYLLQGLHIHPESQLLYTDLFKVELDAAMKSESNIEDKEDSDSQKITEDEIPNHLKRVFVVYQQAVNHVKDVKFIIELLNVANSYQKTEKLQDRITSDMIQEYAHEPLMWDTMARRELEGLSTNAQSLGSEPPPEVDGTSQISLRDRISACNTVYQTAVKIIKTEEMWSLYIDCLMEINHQTGSLPNFKRKLLKTALSQADQAKKLKEKYYLHWVEMLNHDKKDEAAKKKIYEVLCSATESIPGSVNLWLARFRYLLASGQDEEAATVFKKATQTLKDKSLPLWRMRLLHVQAKSPELTESVFKAALQEYPSIVKDMKPMYIEWLVLTQGIQAARKVYENLCVLPPLCLELHKKMAAIEIMQPDISLKHARRTFEMAVMQFGKNDVSVWTEYIMFEMKQGEPVKVGDIHRRAVKTLEPALTDLFISEYSLLKANPDTINTES